MPGIPTGTEECASGGMVGGGGGLVCRSFGWLAGVYTAFVLRVV